MGDVAHFLVLLFFSVLINVSNKVEAQVCTILYKDGLNNTQEKFPMLDGSHITNFEEEYVTVDTAWNHTNSFHLEKGCVLTACNETNFGGLCKKYSATVLQPSDGLEHFLSASCECHSDCKCSDIHMRRNTCARLYLEGCDKCNPTYTDFVGSKNSFSNQFQQGRMQTIKVRSGCTLTIYPEEAQEEEEAVVDDSEDQWSYEGTIGSYNCECDQSKYIPYPKPPRPSSYPAMINIPTSIEEVSRMIQGAHGRHPGLLAAMSSLKNKRSSRNAYILTLGSTGSGKSSAINLFFDNPNVTAVGVGNSTTSNIHEFRIPIPVDELGIQNSELRVIDTPGLLDTRGLEQDAKFLATLDEYLLNHEELHNKIPNIVFVFHKFTDNRFSGVGSNFVKMLRGLDSFRPRITDATYSNVIFVLSHFCSETPAIKKNPNERLRGFKTVIQEFSLYPKPIVLAVAENKADEYNLPLVNGFYKLPNGDLYPRNLFDKIQKVTQSASDRIGDAVIRTAFRNSENFNISSSTYNLVGKGNKKVSHYYNIMINAILDVETTEVSQILDKSYQTMDTRLKTTYPDSLVYLQKSLNIRNIRTRTDIPQTTLNVLELLTSLRQNEAILYLLQHALEITPPKFPTNVIAGHSFHVFKDAPSSRSPFALGEVTTSDIGYMFPSALSCSVEKQVADFIEFPATRQDFLDQRVIKLGIEGKIAVDRYTGEIRPGFNIQSESFTNTSCTITAVREIRTFGLVLKDKPVLSPEFKAALFALPVYNETDAENVLVWINFFDNYGTHAVRSIYGGGAIEITLRSNKKCNPASINKALFSVIQFAEDLTSIQGGNNSALTAQEGMTHQLKFKGGDAKYHTTDLTKMTLDDASALLNNWKDSLKLNPTILTTQMSLIPLSEIARKVGQKQNITSEIQRATSLYFNSDLKVKPRSAIGSSGVGGGRETVAPVQDSGGFSEILKMMMAQQAESNKRFELMMAQFQSERHAAKERREKYRLEQKERDRASAAQQFNLTMNANLQQKEAARQREKERNEYIANQQKEEKEWREKQAQMEAKRESARQAQDQRNFEMMKAMMERPTHTSSSCLKEGTLIQMANGKSKSVELLRVGDVLLDHQLKPTTVVGISSEFLMSQTYYGFDNGSFFFTDSHIMAGPSRNSGGGNEPQFYVKDMPRFISQNPLMEYINAEKMVFGKSFEVYKMSNINLSVVLRESVEVFKDPVVYPQDELIYFFQVDSPHGTYFANGYACRHEIPPMDKWPRTMAILFALFNTERMQLFRKIPYTIQNIEKIENITGDIAATVSAVLELKIKSGVLISGVENGINSNLRDEEVTLLGIFSNPTLGAIATKIYGTTAKKLASYLDMPDSAVYLGEGLKVGAVQRVIYNEMINQLETSVSRYFGNNL